MNDLIPKLQGKDLCSNLRESTRGSTAVDHAASMSIDNSSRRKIIAYAASMKSTRR